MSSQPNFERIEEKYLALIKKWEGLSLKPYLCSAGIPTIGYGSTYYLNGQKVTIKDPPITRGVAEQLLAKTAANFFREVYARTPPTLNENQYAALTSITYNIGLAAFGISTLLRKVYANPNDLTIRDEFLRWKKANGEVSLGLLRRRNEEADLYFTPVLTIVV